MGLGRSNSISAKVLISGSAAAALLAMAATSAGAATPAPAGSSSPAKAEVFAGSANGTALVLKAFGHTVTAGQSAVKATNGLLADAQAVGTIVDGVLQTQQHATVNSAGQSRVIPEACDTPALPALQAPLPSLSAGLACAGTAVSLKDNLPVAAALGSVAGINLDSTQLIGQLTQTLQPILSPIQQIFGDLSKTAPQLDPVTATVSQLLQTVETQNTLNATFGNAVSQVVSTASNVTSAATSNGGDIKILGLGVLPNSAPLAEIQVGSSSAKVVYDRATGKATPSFDPALVRVIINPLPATGLGQQVLSVAPGQSLTILQGTPLESTITVAAGSSATNPDGSVTAVSNGVELALLKGVGASSAGASDGGIDLALAQTTASGGGTPPVVTTAASSTPAPAPGGPVAQLPYTGSSPVLPLAGAGVLSVGLIGRRVVRRLRSR